MGRCAEPITEIWGLKDKVTVQGREWALNFVSTRYLLYSWKDFLIILVNVCLCEMILRTYSSTMQTQGHSSRTRVWALNFVSSLYLLPLGGFSLNFGQMFTSVGQYAEPINQPCGLKVKITVEGHQFEPWIWCRLHISFTPGRIFFKRWSNVCLSEMMCRIHNSAMLTQSQVHNWRSPVWALNFEAAPLPFRLPC